MCFVGIEGEYRGVQEKPVPPGDYYLNPYVEAIVPVDVDLRQVQFEDVYFPSRDGFTIQPDTTVTIHTGPGKNRALNLYWGQGGYIWNNTGDKATLKNASAKVVDTCAYDGTGSAVAC